MMLPAEFFSGAPEIFLSFMGLLLLMVGVFSKGFSKWMDHLVMGAFLGTLFILLPEVFGNERVGFYGLFVANTYTQFAKVLLLGSAFLVSLMGFRHLKREGITDFEYPLLALYATVGMMVMVSANDLMTLFIGLELQSLPLYIMVSMHRGRLMATEGGIKYFVLGALSTALILFGMSLIYGFAGTTEFQSLLSVLSAEKTLPGYAVVGMVLLFAGMGFKLSLAPFHMWTPDVYQASSTPVAAFLAAAPKGAALLVFIRICFEIFFRQHAYWAPLVITLSSLSILVGSFGALYQKDIKRLLAYSSIAHMGFALLGLVGGTFVGVRSTFTYAVLYLVMTIGIFACLLCLKKRGKSVEKIEDLAGLSKYSPLIAGCLTVALFSLAGIPPLAGFMAKFGVFMAAIEGGYYWLSVLGILASVVAAGYYLRVIKVIYFDDFQEGEDISAFEVSAARETTGVMMVMTLIMLFYIVAPEIVTDPVYKAIKSLFYRL